MVLWALATAAVVIWRMNRQAGNAGFIPVASIETGDPVRSVWGVAGTKLLVAATQAGGEQSCGLRIWQTPQWNTATVLSGPCGPVAVSRDGDRAAWSLDGYLPTIVTANNVQILTMGPQAHRHTGEIRALSFSRDGSDLYSAAADGFVRRWTVGNGKFLADLPDSDRRAFQSLLVTSDLVAAGEVASGSGARIKVWASQQKEPAVLEGAHDTIAAMAYDLPSQLFFAGARNGEVLVWRLTDEPNSVVQPIRTDAPATEPVQSLAIVSGTRLIAAYAHAMFSWGFSSTGMDRPEGFRTAPPISGAAAIGDEHSEFLAVGKGSDRSIQIWRVLQ